METLHSELEKHVVVIGAGPAGLTAAAELSKSGIKATVLEKDQIVGGISRTVSHNGYHYDIGGHRFFTKVQRIEDMWFEFIGDDFIERNRISRILYNQKFFHYPLRIPNALAGLGLVTSVQVGLSYLKARLFPSKREDNFEQFVSNRFGEKLYSVFFKTYTEKVWGIPCREISAEWAAQRIKGLSLASAVKNALIGNRFTNKQTVIKTLIDSFHYPRLGPGMMWEKVTKVVKERGVDVQMGVDVSKINLTGGRVSSVETTSDQGTVAEAIGSDFISTMPVRELIQKLEPAAPPEVLAAANDLKYRDFLTVALVIDQEHLFDDNWIYIHDRSVKVGRIQNFKNWSPEMVPDSSKTCVGLEYFCFDGDGLWTTSDEDLIKLGSQEMEKLGFFSASDVIDGSVVRMPKAYPVYDETYAQSLEVVKDYLNTNAQNLQLVGRNGMHKYNNQDHSMLTAMFAVENINGGNRDLWSVNVEQDYHEEVSQGSEGGEDADAQAVALTQPQVPRRVGSEGITVEDYLVKMDKLSFGLALALLVSLFVALFTFLMMFLGNANNEPTLLAQFLIGYRVSFGGALIGSLHGFVWGFLAGWTIAYIRNFAVSFMITRIRRRTMKKQIRDILDYV